MKISSRQHRRENVSPDILPDLLSATVGLVTEVGSTTSWRCAFGIRGAAYAARKSFLLCRLRC